MSVEEYYGKRYFSFLWRYGYIDEKEIGLVNFYIGNSINEIDVQDTNVEFSDELIHFIYKKSRQISCDMSKLYEIDPYDDVEVAENDLPYIIGICNYILSTSLLDEYGERKEGKRMLRALAEMAHEAMARSLGLVSVGD